MSSNELKRDFSPERPESKITERASQHHLGSRNPESRVLDPSVAMRGIAEADRRRAGGFADRGFLDQGVGRGPSVGRPALCVGRRARHRGHKAP